MWYLYVLANGGQDNGLTAISRGIIKANEDPT